MKRLPQWIKILLLVAAIPVLIITGILIWFSLNPAGSYVPVYLGVQTFTAEYKKTTGHWPKRLSDLDQLIRNKNIGLETHLKHLHMKAAFHPESETKCRIIFFGRTWKRFIYEGKVDLQYYRDE